MTNAVVIEEAHVLVPNKEHKNFTQTREKFPKGTEMIGTYKSIKGKRRGEDFTYRVFITDNGEIIYSNKITEHMKPTEVYLGADASKTPTTVDLVPAETFKASRILGLVAGGLGAYLYCKKKKIDRSKRTKIALLGAAIGYSAVYLFDKTKNVTITQSK